MMRKSSLRHQPNRAKVRANPLCANAAGAVAPGPRPPVPDSEVIARPRLRSFTAEYRRSILDQADAAHDAGAVGLLLRREGLYSSHLATWRRQRKQGGIDALTPKKRGPKVVVSPLVKENREQQATSCWATRFRTSRSKRRIDERRLGKQVITTGQKLRELVIIPQLAIPQVA